MVEPTSPMPQASSLLPARLLVPWAVLLALAVVCGLGLGVQGADYPTAFAVAHTYPLVVAAELVVLLVVVPLAAGGEHRAPRAGLLELVLLWVMAGPVVVVAWWVSDGDAASVAASQAYVLAVAWLVAGYVRADARGRLRAVYWAVVGALGAGAPVVAFVVGDHLRAPATWLCALSPFWVAARLSGPWRLGWEWGAPFAALVGLAGVLQVWAGLGRRVIRDA